MTGALRSFLPPGLARLILLWAAGLLVLTPELCATESATPDLAAQLQHDWDVISTRQRAADGRSGDYVMALLDIALRQPERPIAGVALGVAEHLTRSETLVMDYPASLKALEQFDLVADGLPGALAPEPPSARLSLSAWYLLERLHARCLSRAGRVLDAQAQTQRLHNAGVSNAWTGVGPFGRDLAWAFDTVYPPELDIGAATPLSFAGAEYNWHPLTLNGESGGWSSAASIEPAEGVAYLRSPLFSLLENKQAAAQEPVQILVWSTGPWKLKIAGSSAETAVTMSCDPGQVAGSELRLFETQLLRGRPYRLLVKLPAGTTDFNVLLIDPRTHRPLKEIHAVTPGNLPANPPLRELPLVIDTLGAVLPATQPAPGVLAESGALSTGDAIRLAIAAYAIGAYDQARYYLRPLSRQSAVLEYWYLLSFLSDSAANTPANQLELQGYVNGAAWRNPGNVEIQTAAIELLIQQQRPLEAKSRLAYLHDQYPSLMELRLLDARVLLAIDPTSDIAALLAPIPDRQRRARAISATPVPEGPADTPTTPAADATEPFSPWFLQKHRLLLQTQLRDHRFAAARATLDALLSYYARGHAAHCLWLPRDRACPVALTCDPELVMQVAQLYLTAGHPEEGFATLFSTSASDVARPIEHPLLAEWAWRLTNAARSSAGTPAQRKVVDEAADAAWQRLRELMPNSPRLWRALGDARSLRDNAVDSASAYAESVRLDNRQRDLLQYLPHYAGRFGEPGALPAPSLAAAQTGLNPALPVLPGTQHREARFLSYLPQGDCVLTRVFDDRFAQTAVSDPIDLPRDPARAVIGIPRSVRSFSLFDSPTRERAEKEEHAGIARTSEGPKDRQSNRGMTALRLPVPRPLPPGVAAATTVLQSLTETQLAALEPGYPPVQLIGPASLELPPDSLQVIAAVPENLAARISAEPIDPVRALADNLLVHSQAPTEYGTLGTGGTTHDWRLSLPHPPAAEPDAVPAALRGDSWMVGRALTEDEIARLQFRPDRFQIGLTRELQEEAERIRRLTGLSGVKLLERLRLAVIAYVPEDQPDWHLNAAAVLRTGTGSRAVLFLALARALQLPQPVVPAYLVANPRGTPANLSGGGSPLTLLLQQSWQPTSKPLQLSAALLQDAGTTGNPLRIFDLTDYAPADGPGSDLPARPSTLATPWLMGRPSFSATMPAPIAPALFAGGAAVLAGELPGNVPHRVIELPAVSLVFEPAAKAAVPPLYEVFEIQLTIPAAGATSKTTLDVAGSWDGPAAQRQLIRTERFPRMGFDAESVWRGLLREFPLAARPRGAAVELPLWEFGTPQMTAEADGKLALTAVSESLDRPGLPGCNSFTAEASLDGTAYAAVQADGRLRCDLPLRQLQLDTRWAPLSERRQPLLFTEWRMAREFVHLRAANRAPSEAVRHTIHIEFKPLVVYDLEIAPGPRQRWDATRTLRIRPGIVSPEEYPHFKQVLEQIAEADRTVVFFKPAQ